ncbi:hypothetical protein MNBD_GAMMA04-675 [hydrothermal vent metagenome]|uniref:DUF3392 domain-containing protein n=1 Tax=hydrothermal vent metagenome TaxID=652676 RepID=A0A3B0VV21_9ZZZZ
MDLTFLIDLISPFAEWLQGYLYEIGLAMVSTLLIIYGSDILGFIKKQIGGVQPFLRLTLFIIICAFGFAFLTSFLTPLLFGLLHKVDVIWLPLIVLVSFYLIGFLAQKKGFI